MELPELLTYAEEHGASDLHLSSNHPPIFRIHGDMVTLKVAAMKPENVQRMIDMMLNEQQRAEFAANKDLDCSLQIGTHRFRVNVFFTANGPACCLRKIASEIVSLEALRAPPICAYLSELSKGLVLVTGPTGSGKSTTIAAMVDHINKNFYKHILTIEDPIEFLHTSHKSLINQREIGTNSTSFARALKGSLREDPDVIMVGELRDIETIHLAMTAAETGHLVLATLHTSSAAQTVDRIIDVFPPEDKDMVRTMLSGSLEGVISQKLFKKKDGKGRVAAYEVLIANPAIRNLIREGKTPQINSLIQINSKVGMKSMKDSIQELADQNIISKSIVVETNPDPQDVKHRVASNPENF